MALSGLAWIGFLIGHLLGNLTMFKSPEAFNAYADALHQLGGGLLIPLAEIGLATFFLAHMLSGIRTYLANKAARKQGYAVNANSGKSTLASRTMIIGGVVLAAFIVVHLWQLRLTFDPGSDVTLWTLTVTTLKDPLTAGFYIVAMFFLGLHLSHGFGSAFQTLGILRPDMRAALKKFGQVFGWLVAVGFMSFPVWALLVAKV